MYLYTSVGVSNENIIIIIIIIKPIITSNNSRSCVDLWTLSEIMSEYWSTDIYPRYIAMQARSNSKFGGFRV